MLKPFTELGIGFAVGRSSWQDEIFRFPYLEELLVTFWHPTVLASR
jgi:hypothetical protein